MDFKLESWDNFVGRNQKSRKVGCLLCHIKSEKGLNAKTMKDKSRSTYFRNQLYPVVTGSCDNNIQVQFFSHK